MINLIVHLKDLFPFLGENGRDPYVTAYLPYNMKELGREAWKRPCMVVIPGGGYHFCSEREAEVIGMHFLPEGYNIFVLNYSLAPHRYPCQLREVAAVLELIHSHADDWNCDTARVAIIGFSAGGHLACHYSNAYASPEVRQVFPESKSVQAAILAYPVISADPAISHRGSFCNLTGHQEPTEEDLEKLSCDQLVTPQTPPTFLWHTASDAAVPVNNSLVYAQALDRNRVPFALHIYPEGQHGLATCDLQTNPPERLTPGVLLTARWLPDVKDWLKTVF